MELKEALTVAEALQDRENMEIELHMYKKYRSMMKDKHSGDCSRRPYQAVMQLLDSRIGEIETSIQAINLALSRTTIHL